ncbi:MAG: NAD(P)H-dependent oxidoreductase [Fusobacteriaceae bacterium]|jgi:FMN-dependent NADH-azoreductase|nr:NAD(P)H-dependent oxidoreductase [Fusobacteriaceae bacterium]
MSKVLYITANPKKIEESYSLTVGEEFIREYIKLHPNDIVTRVDLFKKELYNIDEDLINYKFGKLSEENASQEAKAKIKKLNETLDEFIDHDKYVFVTPLWNFGLPPVVKTYFDNVSIARKTFRYTANGSEGLLGGRKALHIQASGGIHSTSTKEPFAHGTTYIKSILTFFGIPDLLQILIEGVNLATSNTDEIKKNAIEKAKQLAKTF